MATITFENGTRVNFEGNPTPQDVEEVAARLGLAKSEPPAEAPKGKSIGGFLGNVAKSGAGLIGGIAKAVFNPVETVKGVGSIALGGVQKLIPGRQTQEGAFDSVVDFYKNRYGSTGKLLDTAYEDPFGVAADASTLLTGGAGVLGAASKLGKATELAGAAAKVGQIGAKVDPILAGARFVTPRVAETFPRIAQTLEKQSLRLTPAQKANLGKKADEIAGFLSEQRIVGSPEARFHKATALYDSYENTLQDFLKKQDAKKARVSKSEIIDELQGIPARYKNNRDFDAIERQVKGAITSIRRNQPRSIPLSDLNELKRSTYSQAYNKAGEKVLDAVEHDIADVLRTRIEKALKGKTLTLNGEKITIAEFNRRYGLLIKGRKLLKVASGRTQMSGFNERILGALLGSLGVGPGIGTIGGALLGPSVVENLPITATRSAVSSALVKASKGRVPTPLARAGRALTPLSRAGLLSGVAQQQ